MAIIRKFCDQLHRRKRSTAARSKSPSGILLLSSGGLGDTILFSIIAPIFGALADTGEKITVVMQHSSAAVEFLFPKTFEILPLNYRNFIRRPIYRYSFIDKIFSRNFRLASSRRSSRRKKVLTAIFTAVPRMKDQLRLKRGRMRRKLLILTSKLFARRWSKRTAPF